MQFLHVHSDACSLPKASSHTTLPSLNTWPNQVQKNDNAIRQVNCYTVDWVVRLVNQDLSSHWMVINPVDSDSLSK